MKRILLVDDEVSFVKSVSDGLAVFEALEIVTAGNGAEAVKVLRGGGIDLVITDIQMPKMDGFELLAYLTKHHIGMPVIVISAFTTPQMRDDLEKMGAVVCLDKPIDFDELADRIFKILLEQSTDTIRGISVASFLQLLSMERKTCCLRVKKKGKVGYLVMRAGYLIHARVGNLTGDVAAFELVGWGEAQIDMESRIPAVASDITRGLNFIIMEGLRLADESVCGESSGRQVMQSDAPEAPVSSLKNSSVEKKEAPKSKRAALTGVQRSSVAKGEQRAEQQSKTNQWHLLDSTPPSSARISNKGARSPLAIASPKPDSTRQIAKEFAVRSGIEPGATEQVRAWSQQNEPTTDQSMELSVSGATTGPRVNHGIGEVAMNMQKLQAGLDNLKNTLGAGLLASDVFGPEGMSLLGFGASPQSASAMLEVSRQIRKQLETAGFSKLGRYFMIELEGNKMVGVILMGDYSWGALVDLSKVSMGVLVTVAVPQTIKDMQEALAG